MFYSITYYNEAKQMAYVDNKTFQSADKAAYHALSHLLARSPKVVSAVVIYQGKNKQVRVRSLSCRNLEPSYK